MTINSGQDTNKTNMKNMLVGLYYYVLDSKLLQENNEANTSIFSFVPTIHSISFNPFINLESSDFNVVKCEFDSQHYGSPSSINKPYVYRLLTQNKSDSLLFEIEIWNKAIIEPILETYPYKYYLLCDYLNPPLLIQPQLINSNNNKLSVRVKVSLSQTSKYNLYVEGYKGDKKGNIEGSINNNPLMFPVGSSAYSQFLASSGTSFSQSNVNSLLENDMSLKHGLSNLNFDKDKNNISSLIGGISSLLDMNFGGVATNLVNASFNNKQNNMQTSFLKESNGMKEYNIESMALAKTTDLLNTPRTMKSVGNDSIFNIENGDKRIDLIEYGLKNENKIRLENYFKRYGNKVNRYGIPNTRSRKFYNFVKCSKCNIDSSRIPYNDLKEIEEIFESGITLWHTYNGVKIKDYSINNMEV